MAGTSLRISRGTLTQAILNGFADLGYVYAPLTETANQYFVRVLNGLTSESYSHRTTSPNHVLALILAHLIGSPVSELVLGRGELLGEDYDQLPFSGGGGGPAPYHADAVHFDGTVKLVCDALTTTNSANVSGVWWFNIPAWNGGELWVVDPQGGFLSDAFFSDASDGMPVTIKNDNANRVQVNCNGAVPTLGSWHSVIFTVKTDGGDGLNVVKFYIDRLDVGHVTFNNGSFSAAFNGLPFYVGDDGFGDSIVGDIADFRIMPNVSLLTGGDIASGTLDLFATADNKPVDPSVATAALGTAGAVLLSGNASTFGTNQGTGGAFTTTGTLTNASSSPSD